MNIHQDFLALEEIQFITGRKQKSRIMEQLNLMGIPFIQNANGFPIVRRDYSQPKMKSSKPIQENKNEWKPNVLRTT